MNFNQAKRIICLIFGLAGFEAILGIIQVFISSGEINRPFVSSFSFIEVGIILWLGVAIGALCLFIYTLRNKAGFLLEKIQKVKENKEKCALLTGLLMEIGLITLVFIVFSSAPFWGKLSGYIIRLQPFLAWVLFVDIETLIAWILIVRTGEVIKPLRFTAGVKAGLFSIFIFCLLWYGIVGTGFGIGTDHDAVRAPTVFISFQQLLFAAMMTFQVELVDYFAKMQMRDSSYVKFKKYFYRITLAALWLCAVVIWYNEPMRAGFNVSGPYPPKGDYIPASDSGRFDYPGQTAIIGEGLNNHQYIDNPLYVFFVMLLRLIGGQEFNRMILLQICVLAFIPIILCEIGKTLYDPAAGVLAAFLVILREANMIHYSADTWMAPVKTLMTEPFITLLLALFCLMLMKWLSHKTGFGLRYLILAGGILGLSTLVRANSWFLLPLALMVIFFKTKLRIRGAIKHAFWFGLAFMAAIFPWMIRSELTINTPFYMWFKFQHSVMEERYNPIAAAQNTATDLATAPAIIGLTPTLILENTLPAPTQAEIALAVPTQAETPMIPQAGLSEPPKFMRIGTVISEHFLFNFVNCSQLLPTFLPNSTPGSLVIFPTSVFSEWKQFPLQTISLAFFSFFLVLLLIASGIGVAWERMRWAGMVPICYFLTYSAGTAVAISSGSRFSQPIEWVVLLYFALGCAVVMKVFLHPCFVIAGRIGKDDSELVNGEKAEPPVGLIKYVFLFLLIGSLLPLSDIVFPRQFNKKTKEELVSEIDLKQIVDVTGYQNNAVVDYLKNPSSNVYEGKIIYTRYQEPGMGSSLYGEDVVIKDYSRIDFYLIGAEGQLVQGSLPVDEPWPEIYLSGKTAVVIGCNSMNHFDVLVITIPKEEISIGRSAQVTIECP